MPNISYSLALKEAAALADTSVVILNTLEISHETEPSIYLVDDRDPLTATLEDASTEVTFEAVSFGLKLPDSSVEGVQNLSLVLNNTDQRIYDFLEAIDASDNQKVTLTNRQYLSGGPTTAVPENDPPIVLFLTDVEIDTFQVRGKAGFTAIVNTKYPNEYYLIERFPAIGN